MGIGVVVCILYLPRIYKKLKLKHYIGAAIGAALPTGIWAAVRFSYDGLAFFAQMFGVEIVDRVVGESDYLGYIRYFGTKPTVLLALAAVLGALLLLFFQKKEEKRAAEGKSLLRKIIGSRLYLFVVWLLVSLAAYPVKVEDLLLYGAEHARLAAPRLYPQDRAELAVELHDADGGEADVLHVVEVWVEALCKAAQGEGLAHAGACGKEPYASCVL